MSLRITLSELIILNQGTCLDRELAPKDPALGPMGLPPWLEGCTSVRRWSGDLAAAIGWEVAVKLAKGLWTRDWVDIIKTSIRIWPIRSLKSEYTTGGGEMITAKLLNVGICQLLIKLFTEHRGIQLIIGTQIKTVWSDIPSLGFWWNSTASKGRKMTSLSCSFHDTRRILQMSCRACSSETSELAEVSWGAQIETTARFWPQSTTIYRVIAK